MANPRRTGMSAPPGKNVCPRVYDDEELRPALPSGGRCIYLTLRRGVMGERGAALRLFLTFGCTPIPGFIVMSFRHCRPCAEALEARRLLAAPGANWKLVWDDEFNGNHLNASNWSIGMPWNGADGTNLDEGSGTISYISPGDVQVSGGMLHLLTQQQNVTGANGQQFDYTAGFISSYQKFQMTYGYVEINAQIPTTPGTWPAFWMLSPTLPWPPEDDVMEYVTGQDRFHQGLAYGTRADVQWDDMNTYNALPTGFHTYGMEWGPGYQIFTMDGIITHVSRGSYVPNSPLYLLLSTGVSQQFPPTSASTFPNSFDIDYVRVYARPATPEVLYGGFEGGALGPWIGTGSASVTSDNPHSGSYSLQLQGQQSAAQQTITGLSPNTTYVISGYVSAAAGNQGTLGVNSYGGPDVSSTTTSSDYTLLTVSFKTGKTDHSAVVYGLQSNGTGSVWVDDVSIHQAAQMQNPSFELGTLGDWNSSGSAAVVAGHAITGRFSLEDSAIGDEADQTIYGLSPNTTYRLTAWVRVGSLDDQATLAVIDEDGEQTTATSASTRYKATTVTFTTGPDSTYATVFCSKVIGSTAVWFDDLSLTIPRVPAAKKKA